MLLDEIIGLLDLLDLSRVGLFGLARNTLSAEC